MSRLAVRVLISCAVFCSRAGAQTPIILTIAGFGADVYSGDGGPATSAGLTPTSVAVDNFGNLFISDTAYNRVRKITPDGIISTVAGPYAGFAGDGGPATSALVSGPSGVAVDSSGNLYFADTNNNRIRMLSTSGIITTVAGSGATGFGPGSFSGDGGPATSASLNNPSAVALDASGNLFIADTFNNRIREVAASGIITTVAGSGPAGFGPGSFSGDGGPATAASLYHPSGIAVDTSGNLFVADTFNSRIRKVSPSGIITTVAGNGNGAFFGDGGPAALAALSYPSAVAVNGSGDLFIADTENNRIRKVTSSGIITTVAGDANPGFSGDLGPPMAASLNHPQGIAVDASGNLFIADTGNNRIREVSASTPALAATFSVDPAMLYAGAAQGAPNQSEKLQIGGAAGTSWQAMATTQTGGDWLSISPASGQGPASPIVMLNTSSLMPGSYYGTITFRAPGAIPPSITINLQLQVSFQPAYIYQITNAASSYLSGQNGFGIAQGSLFVIYGDAIGPATLQQASSFPIPLTLAGTSVQLNMAGANYNAPLIYTSYSQVAAILPSNVPIGDGTVVVTYNGNPAEPLDIHVVKSQFGIFTVTSNGAGVGVIQDANNSQFNFAQPAHPGDTVTLWGTGLGPVSGAETNGPLPGNLFTAEVFVGNQAAPVQYAGRSGCCAALDEIAFQIPPGVQGCLVPVVVRTGGVVSNFVSLSIAGAGEACSDPVGFTPDLFSKASAGPGLNLGVIELGPVPTLQNAGFSFLPGIFERLSALLGTRVTEQELKTIIRSSHARRSRAFAAVMKKYAPILKARHIDPQTIVNLASQMNSQGVAADFGQLTGPGGSPLGSAAQFAGVLPAPGTCTADLESPYRSASFSIAVQYHDAGPQLLLTGPSGTQLLNQTSNGTYELPFGTGSANSSLPSGTYIVSSNGGSDVGAFSASIQVGSSLTWANKASVGFVDRSAPLTITWSGGPLTGYVVFGGQGASSDGTKAGFTCVADIRNQTLTVPDFVLASIPHTSHGLLFLGEHPLNNLFSAPGLDVGYFTNATTDSKSIGFQ